MNALDWTIVVLYLVGMIGLSAWLSLRQRDQKDYYLGGNNTGPLPIALSTMATQCSTNSLLGAPATVAFVAGGGLVWLQNELAVPFAMIVLMAFLMPKLRSLGLVSIYAYLEKRFSLSTRLLMSATFLLLRAFATGVTVYGAALVVHLTTGIDMTLAAITLGVVTAVYDMLGGMKAVIVSDVIQIIILWGSILAALGMALYLNGGWTATWANFPEARSAALQLGDFGFNKGDTFAFWPMAIGGFFLYLAYYGCDQTQAQRSLSTRNIRETNLALFIGGILRFPLVASYCMLGVAIGAYSALHKDFIMSLLGPDGNPRFDLAVPVFVTHHFPHGLIGLVMVGLFAAAMSSLDSTLNSMSAVTMQDFVERFSKKELSSRAQLIWSKLTTLFWGMLCLGFSFFVDQLAGSILVAINMISSLMNGPLLAIFTMGMLSRRINAAGAISGLVAGLGVNTALWVCAPQVSFLWWNVSGLIAAWVVGYAVSLSTKRPAPEKLAGNVVSFGKEPGMDHKQWMPYYLTLAAYGVGIFILLACL
ncbi:sodium/solute symporter [Ruficoccus sp. ZRK36]|uniref:sodium:solute symporter family transporter n=1 Tax=Ruficoccus sp. ZRK36 TaxID=2866311 RepID=UPI001C73C387|nr:sodium/solute symporter [Ruficoccus sp. ZRK36]QYY36401.1 sodium/solute symporter [Ruficoccus sp. ZRK36]